jgi:hypothetical protein
MEFYVEAGSKTKQFIETVLPSMLSQLGLSRSRRLLMVKVDSEMTELGATVPMTGINTYLIVLRPTKDLLALGITLAHELTHVAQFAKGMLKVTPRGKKWRGKFYPSGYPYLQQPWEIQAFAKQEIVFRRAID